MCGIFALLDEEPVTDQSYQALLQLQHRGQDAAGIFSYDPITDKHVLHKEKGLVSEVFRTDPLALATAKWAIGHVRYATIGKGCGSETQPLYLHGYHTLAMAHNGNIVNYIPLRKKLESHGLVFETESDLEVLLHLFFQQLPMEKIHFALLCRAAEKVCREVDGAFSVVGLIGKAGVFAFRDPYGMRPLLFSAQKKRFAFASETNALSVLGFSQIESLKPGELVFIDENKNIHRRQLLTKKPAPCAFEWNYFSKPNTIIDGKEVYSVRTRLGELLGQEVRKKGLTVDVVIPIPTTARVAATALAQTLNVSYEEGFVKQDNIGRTFIMPTQGSRQNALRRKLAPVLSVFKDKRVLLVDDSIVRGTVSKKVIQLAREAGAKNVYFASTFPPITHPCLYGIDFPLSAQLLAHGKEGDEISELIQADAVIYNTLENLRQAIGKTEICSACVTGRYPTKTQGSLELQALREKHLHHMETTCQTPLPSSILAHSTLN